MSVLCLVSAHGSPGVTTTALALAATWPEHRRCLLVEADLCGGVISARYGVGDTPGVASLAAAARRGGVSDELVWEHVQRLPGGLQVLVGPPSPDESHAVLRDIAGELARWAAAQPDVAVIVDGGRITGRAPSIDPLLRTSAVLVVTRPILEQLRPAGIRVEALQTAGLDASVLLVGDQPYGPTEVASSLHCPVAATIAWDPKTAAVLSGAPGAMRDLRRSPLIRSAATLAADLAVPVGAGHPPANDAAHETAQPASVKEAGL